MGSPEDVQAIDTTEQDRAVLGAGRSHGSAAVMLSLLLPSFASPQCHADALLEYHIWRCWS